MTSWTYLVAKCSCLLWLVKAVLYSWRCTVRYDLMNISSSLVSKHSQICILEKNLEIGFFFPQKWPGGEATYLASSYLHTQVVQCTFVTNGKHSHSKFGTLSTWLYPLTSFTVFSMFCSSSFFASSCCCREPISASSLPLCSRASLSLSSMAAPLACNWADTSWSWCWACSCTLCSCSFRPCSWTAELDFSYISKKKKTDRQIDYIGIQILPGLIDQWINHSTYR